MKKHKSIKIYILGCFLLLSIFQTVYAQKNYELISPNKKLKMTVSQSKEDGVTYSFIADGKLLIKPSQLGLALDGNSSTNNWVVAKSENRKVNTVWKPVWGKRAVVADKFNEITLLLEGDGNVKPNLKIIFRMYDDGLAFRYVFSDKNVKTVSDLTKYNFAGDYTACFYNGENPNLGPKKLSDCDGTFLPVMTIQADDSHFMALHEAELIKGSPLVLNTKKGNTSFSVSANMDEIGSEYKSAWRVILYGSTPGAMVDSHIIELLNPNPSPEMDFSWVKPGVAVWDWRIDGAIIDDFKYSMSYPSWTRMVDFASEQGFNYLVLDANWYGPEFKQDSDPLKGNKASDVKKIIQYGKNKKVGVWLYLNDVGGKKFDIDQTLKQYGEWGASGVKYGFMTGTPKEKNNWTQKITALCAKNHLLVDFHDGPVHPYGQMRTWPNAVTREFCHAQLDAHRVFEPKTFVTTVFVNMLSGPIDMNNGMFDLRQGNTTRVDENQPVPSTVVSEAARTLIVFSGATIIPDIPEFYKKYPDLLHFISEEKMPWKESKTLDGKIGEYIVMMRQNQEGSFLVGATTNEESRTLTIPLSFLPKGNYELTLVQDTKDSHYLTNRESFKVDKKKVSKLDVITLNLAPGGGACLLIKKNNL
ncbi:glycoside hydrolase family 97 catalytic domain-containing protein [Flavobacterium granuli]|uniref:Alpha-glucosidase n=1 Tax=Flavobacterium granuli TaxID=280093 RepID=A0ABU1S3A2_9FLAO|nr:glycoside hydrolase family 97 catalytic domain-containing protein [Flavobacterium granuli]MDR6844685.1 alpha-glucosidase [Flavobacterium granuli]